MNDDLVMRLRRWYSTYPANYDKELLREAADALSARAEVAAPNDGGWRVRAERAISSLRSFDPALADHIEKQTPVNSS